MLADWIVQSTTSTGTGNLTLAGVSGYPTFNEYFSTTRYFHYVIRRNSDGKPLESGIGHLSASNTLVRDVVLGTYKSSTLDVTAHTPVNLGTDDTDGTWIVMCSAVGRAVAATMPQIVDQAAKFGGSSGGKKLYSEGAQVPNSTRALVANRQYVVPFLLNCAANVNAIGTYVTTGVASAKIRFGLYALDEGGYPKALLAESSAGVSAATSSTRVSSSISETFLTPGWYGLSLVSDSAITIAAASAANIRANPFGLTSTGDGRAVICDFYTSLTYADTGALMPGSWPTTSITVEGSTVVGQYGCWLELE